jgi:hypothetical protein
MTTTDLSPTGRGGISSLRKSAETWHSRGIRPTIHSPAALPRSRGHNLGARRPTPHISATAQPHTRTAIHAARRYVHGSDADEPAARQHHFHRGPDSFHRVLRQLGRLIVRLRPAVDLCYWPAGAVAGWRRGWQSGTERRLQGGREEGM